MGIFDFLKDIPLSAVLREKLKDVESQVERLKSDNQRLACELKERDERIAKLTPVVAEVSEVETQILLALAAHRPDAEVDEPRISAATQIACQLVGFHLEELRRRKLVDAHYYAGLPSAGVDACTNWTLAHDGRAYLAKRGLLR